MLPAFAGAGAISTALVGVGVSLGGFLGWLLAIVAMLAALLALGSLFLIVWGRYAGMPWLFTP